LIWNRLARLVLAPPARVEVLDKTTNPGTALLTPGANFGSVKLFVIEWRVAVDWSEDVGAEVRFDKE